MFIKVWNQKVPTLDWILDSVSAEIPMFLNEAIRLELHKINEVNDMATINFKNNQPMG